MLERLRLLNFQTHRDFKLKFENVTTIVGSSDVGKSSIIRALRWVMQNKPSGDAFIREGENRCSVTLWLDDQKVMRRKGKGKNEYRLNGEELKAFGADVPSPVADLLNLGEVNFQQQHDSPFWFSLTAGQVSRELNTVVDLDIIDRTLANVAKVFRRARSVVDVCEGRMREAEEKSEELSWVPDMTKEWDELQLLEELKEEADEKAGGAECIIEGMKDAKRRANIEVPDLTELEKLKEKVTKLRKEVREHRTIVEGVKEQEEMIESTREQLEEAEEELREKSGGICPLCGSKMKGESYEGENDA